MVVMKIPKIGLCKRCGRGDKYSGLQEVHKCPECENIKFDRDFFIPLEKKVIKNFKGLLASEYGSILKELYIFGSYAEKESKCGDIDFLVTYDREELKNLAQIRKEELWFEFDFFDPKDYSTSELKEFFGSLFWDFRTCEEYPDCLSCHPESGGEKCNLPNEDYNSELHLYCIEKCKFKNKDPIPNCCYGECTFFGMSLQIKILNNTGNILKEDCMEFYEIEPGFKIKILDFIIKENVEQLQNEFNLQKKSKKLIIYKILP